MYKQRTPKGSNINGGVAMDVEIIDNSQRKVKLQKNRRGVN